MKILDFSYTVRGKLGLVLLGGVRQVAPGLTGGVRQVAPGLTGRVRL